MFSRMTLTPLRISCPMVSGESLDGPSVATILVFAIRGRGIAAYLLVGPAPSRDLRGVDAMFVCVPAAGDLTVAELLLGMCADALQSGDAVDGVDGKAEAVGFVVDRQLHRRIDVTFFLVAAHMQVLVVSAPVGQSMDQPRISMEIEDDRLVRREQGVEVLIGKSVRMLRAGLEFEKIDHVDEANLEVGEFLAQQNGRGQSLLSGNIAGRRKNHIRLAAPIVTRP